jgi:uncharacterized protein (DUF488 family)
VAHSSSWARPVSENLSCDRARLLTIGHSTRPVDELVEMLDRAGCDILVDVRRYPTSRRYPWFDARSLEVALASAGIAYLWEGRGLGGRLSLGKVFADAHRGLKSEGFRSYAAHLYSQEAAEALRRIFRMVRQENSLVALMCAERLWFKCHRMILADAFTLAGVCVEHLIDMSPQGRRKHRLTEACGSGVLGLMRYESNCDTSR